MRAKKAVMGSRTLLMVILIGVLVGVAWASTGYAAIDCGPDPCPGTLPATWPHPSATVEGSVRILGWNLAPSTLYEIVLVQPDGTARSTGYVTTDIEGDFIGRFDGAYGQPYVCTVGDLALRGIYEVLVYLSPWSGSLDEVPVATTSFHHN